MPPLIKLNREFNANSHSCAIFQPYHGTTLHSYCVEKGYFDKEELAEDYQVDINLLRLWKLVESIKMDMFCYIFTNYDITCEINSKDVDHEGYVMDNDYGTYKIVDRYTFSYHNFNCGKFN